MTMRPALLGIRHVALFVKDLEAAERFWVDVMGYEVEWRPDADNVYLRGGTDNLALHRNRVDEARLGRAESLAGGFGNPVRVPEQDARLDHIGLAVPEAADVDAWARHLAAHGVTPKSPPRTHRDGSRSLYFYAPENLLVQIIHHAPMSQA
jgi:catechol 2,3-dioxygenase-like lactoylglutathione lyase family enzyme